MSGQEAGQGGETPEWMRRRERGNRFWLFVMRWLSLLFGRQASRIVLYFIALYFLLAVPRARAASRNYLTRCLGRPVTWADLYYHFLIFASTIHDRVYLLNDRHELFDLHASGSEALDQPHAGRGFLLFGAHLGSFEVLRSLARNNERLKVCMAMYPENARQINETLSAINPRAMQDIIALGKLDAILSIHHKLKEGVLVGVLADRAAGSDQYICLPFLGAPARFPTGPFRMAAMLRHPVYFMAGLHLGGNRYDIHFELLEDFASGASAGRDADVRALLEKYVAALERHCRAAPFNWFNFYDFWETAEHA
ncbi:LpxL/LpxP family acyltransferase [Rhodocyclus tenuis]|uniref:Acyl-CoA synthetase n=1 Tax=Rhodocyclus tenuis TaxID=1066 RepID=A0A840G4Z6_RHOTE|nr:acyl-CoA synthetase [Rhodocyclus tenuis]MBB4245818.1 hypothetical protein [Rhodocyclus tenuis]